MTVLRAAVCVSALAMVLPLACAKRLRDNCELMKTCPPEGGSSGESSVSGGVTSGGVSSGGSSLTAAGGETQAGGSSGAAGETSTGGTTQVVDACGNACSGDTAVCDETDGTCVECIRTEHCSEGVCDPRARACVGCMGSEDCTAPEPYCETGRQECVECLSSKNCSSPTASKCVEGKCEACIKDEDCAGVPGKSVCDSGQCVECTGKSYAKCGSSNGMRFVCDSLKRECSKTALQQSSGPCQPCVSDAQCKPGQMCVLDRYGSPAQDVGHFCHWIQGADVTGAPKDCPAEGRPFVAVTSKTVSIDGATGDVCSLRTSTCSALNQFSATDCSKDGKADDSLCGVAPGKDSKCAAFGSLFRCTTTCATDDDCKAGFGCDLNASPNVCKFQ